MEAVSFYLRAPGLCVIYKIGKLTQRQNDVKHILHFAYRANCLCVIWPIVGQMKDFTGNNVCISPTDIHPRMMS
jgi:hypothetical protein